jgi:hypothetical protein
VCREKPARCEGVKVSNSEGLAGHTGSELCAAPGNGRSEALTGECAGRVSSPEIGRFSGADTLLTRGRQPWVRCYGNAYTHLAGSKTPGMHRNIVTGTREALGLTWRFFPGPHGEPRGDTTVMYGHRESDSSIVCAGQQRAQVG